MNIMIICEKKSNQKLIENIIKKNKDIFKDIYYFNCAPFIVHTNYDLLFHKKLKKIKEGEYVYHKDKYKSLQLNTLEIPNDSYIEEDNSTLININNVSVQKMDKIISVCDNDILGILKFAKYLENNNIDFENAYITKVTTLTNERQIIENLQKLYNFKKIFTKASEVLKEKNFALLDYNENVKIFGDFIKK